VNARRAISVNPALVLDGPTPRLIDEWQIEPAIWNQVRRTVDDRRDPGQFVLTGSAVPGDDITRHTGAGRVSRLRMRPMSLFEAGRSTGDISLAEMLAGGLISSVDQGPTVAGLAEEVARGGWPGLRGRSVADGLVAVRSYLDEIARVDVGRLDAIHRDPSRVARLLASLARNVATHAAATTLAKDTGGADGPLKDDTVRAYLAALERLMVVDTERCGSPALLGVIVATGYGYVREDGIAVIPIGALGP
jgi:predicted AAA+ superfamily ATPase